MTEDEEHQTEPSARLRAPLLRLPALPGHERDRVPPKKPPPPVDGAQPGLGQSEPLPDRPRPGRHAPDFHRRLPQERHHADARDAGCPRARAVWRGDPGDSPPADHAGQLESLGEGEDPPGRGRRHRPGVGRGSESLPAGGERFLWRTETPTSPRRNTVPGCQNRLCVRYR